jgi:uncharacterized surface protein with fasciclin (FAS1) repeats
MNKNYWLNKIGILGILVSISVISCNKDVDAPVPNERPAPTGKSIGTILSETPSYSLLLAIASKVGLAGALSDSSKVYTVFAPDNNAIKQFVSVYTNGAVPSILPDAVFLTIISGASPGLTDTLRGVLNYHIIPGLAIKASSISDTFPNTQLPTNFIVPPPSNTSPLVRLNNYISRRNTANAWINNVPVSSPDLAVASNGVIHGIAAVLVPPARNIWQTINADPQLTYLKAALNKADSAALSKDSLGAALRNFFLNATVFAPTDDAFKSFLLGALTSRGVPENIALDIINNNGTNIISNPGSISSPIPNLGAALASLITARNVKGILVYHVLSSKNPPYAPPGLRYFSVNLPTTLTSVKTLLNSDTLPILRNHPGLTLSATFTGPDVTSATVKGLANPTASDIIISSPPSNTHDLHQTNGVIHKIKQVLLPSPL